MIPAPILQRLRAESGPPKIRSAEELDAYVKSRILELDGLIQDIEMEIERLSKANGGKEARAWLSGALKGLQLARAAWSLWGEDG